MIDAGLGLLNHFAQQLNVFALSLSIKSWAATLLLVLFVALFAQVVIADLATCNEVRASVIRGAGAMNADDPQAPDQGEEARLHELMRLLRKADAREREEEHLVGEYRIPRTRIPDRHLDSIGMLTKTEVAVLRFPLGWGRSNQDIAMLLVISENTVRVHLNNMCRKLELDGVREAERARRAALPSAELSGGYDPRKRTRAQLSSRYRSSESGCASRRSRALSVWARPSCR